MLEKQSETIFEPTLTVNQAVEKEGESPSTGLRALSAAEEAARCLKAYISAHDVGIRLSRFLDALATEVLVDLDKGGTGLASTKSIYLTLDPNGDPEKASNRISGIWNDWEKKSKDRLVGLQDYAANRGLAFYPWPVKRVDSKGGAGRPTQYAIEAQPIEPHAYSTETGHSVHGKLDSRSVATRGFWFYSESCFLVKLFLRFRIDSPVSVS